MPERGDDKPDAAFLKRWSRRKAEAEGAAAESPGQDLTPGAPKDREPAIDPADLPEIESLDADSDYSVFMKDGVPEELKKLALRKLWMSNPIFSSLDGLNDYDDDYSLIGMVAEKVNTAYQVGRGYADEVDDLIDGDDGEVEDIDDSVDSDAGDAGATAATVEAAEGGSAPDPKLDSNTAERPEPNPRAGKTGKA